MQGAVNVLQWSMRFLGATNKFHPAYYGFVNFICVSGLTWHEWHRDRNLSRETIPDDWKLTESTDKTDGHLTRVYSWNLEMLSWELSLMFCCE